jgi:hypothetical protein
MGISTIRTVIGRIFFWFITPILEKERAREEGVYVALRDWGLPIDESNIQSHLRTSDKIINAIGH